MTQISDVRRTRAAMRLLSACVAGAAVFSIACKRPEPVSPADVTLRIGFGMSGAVEQDRVMRQLTRLLYAEPLLSYQWDGRPTGRIAEAWTWEDGGRLLRIRLREGVRFHDDSPVRAADVATFLTRQIEAAQKRPRPSSGFRYVQAVHAEDERILTIRLAEPDTHLIGELGDTSILSLTNPDIGTGPFRITSRKPHPETVRFDRYYQGRSAIAKVTIMPFDTQRSAWAAVMRGDIDVVQEVARESVEFLEGASNIRTYSSVRPFYIPLVFNIRHPVLRNVEVRRALSEAVNRAEIVTHAMQRRGQVADDPIWPFHWAYSGATQRYAHDAAAARRRLDAAGVTVRTSGGGTKNTRLGFDCLFYDGEPEFERIALLLQRQFADVGVDMTPVPMKLEELATRARTGGFDSFLLPTGSGRAFDLMYKFWHSSPQGTAEYFDSGYTGADAALDRLRRINTDAEVRVAVADLQRRFYEDAPAVFLAWQEVTRAVDARFDVGDRTDPDVFANLWRWRPVADAGARPAAAEVRR